MVGTPLRAFAHPTSKPSRQRQSYCQRLCWMHMAIRDAVDWLARQARQIIIFDLVGIGIEEVEHVELQPQPVVELVACPRIEDQRGLRTDAIVFDQRTRPEI